MVFNCILTCYHCNPLKVWISHSPTHYQATVKHGQKKDDLVNNIIGRYINVILDSWKIVDFQVSSQVWRDTKLAWLAIYRPHEVLPFVKRNIWKGHSQKYIAKSRSGYRQGRIHYSKHGRV